MGYGFMCRETWWRDWSLELRGELHPWRGGNGEGGGLQSGPAEVVLGGVGGEGDTTLGGSCVGTLGRPSIGIRGGQKDGSASSCHALNMSRRLAMASTWEMLVGGAAPVRARATT
jgi:hypothetical protein